MYICSKSPILIRINTEEPRTVTPTTLLKGIHTSRTFISSFLRSFVEGQTGFCARSANKMILSSPQKGEKVWKTVQWAGSEATFPAEWLVFGRTEDTLRRMFAWSQMWNVRSPPSKQQFCSSLVVRDICSGKFFSSSAPTTVTLQVLELGTWPGLPTSLGCWGSWFVQQRCSAVLLCRLRGRDVLECCTKRRSCDVPRVPFNSENYENTSINLSFAST